METRPNTRNQYECEMNSDSEDSTNWIPFPLRKTTEIVPLELIRIAFKKKRLKTIENESLNRTETEQKRNISLNESKIPYVLTTFPIIIENIFKFLPARDLASCAIVCSSWNSIVTSIKKKRRTILFIRVHELANEKLLFETLLRCWSEPDLVIVFGSLGICTDVEMDIFGVIMRHESAQESVASRYLYGWFSDEILELLSAMKSARACLPEKCHFIRIPVTTFSKMLRDDKVIFDSLTSLIIPSLPGVEMGAFSLPFTNVNVKMDRFYVPKVDACDTSETELKCILLFTNHANNVGTFEKDILANTSLEKYISDKTIIAGGKVTCLPVVTGITFAGEKVDIECFCLNGEKCCTRSLLTGLKKLGFQNKTGVAFLLSTFISQKFTCNLFQKLFPNFLLLGIVYESGGLMYPSYITNTSVKPCDVCGRVLNTHDHKVSPSVVIIFVMFQKVCYEVIKL